MHDDNNYQNTIANKQPSSNGFDLQLRKSMPT